MNHNAWGNIKPADYDAHMSHPDVAQTQMLNRIIKEQFELIRREKSSDSCAAILGITNGNGLEHAAACGVAKIVGIDINEAFLNECKARYHYLESSLKLFQLDLTAEASKSIEILSECDLIIANLVIKHIRLDSFTSIIAGLPKRRRIVSCVIQVNPDGIAVSHSGFEHAFDEIGKQEEEENEERIKQSMEENGFTLANRVTYDLPNGKYCQNGFSLRHAIRTQRLTFNPI
ncbi:MAG: class I SAM-dependent methyltransferase [Clostridiales bacterium]|jgi:hypothetical protein|nr:class I SAM-dependent methyltransferase [Clostridiales bacterium]